MKYFDFINRKRVVFVGACPNIMGMNKGHEIDSFDVVVRTNGGFPVQKYLQKDYGTRTDVMYINNQFYRHMRRLNRSPQWYFDQGVKFMCFKSIKEQRDERIRNCLPVIREIERDNKINGLMMGPVIYTDILQCYPRELFLTGIDFMKSKSETYKPFDYPEYYSGYLPREIQEEGNVVKSKNCNGHDLRDNARYILKLTGMYNLKMDDFIQEILLEMTK